MKQIIKIYTALILIALITQILAESEPSGCNHDENSCRQNLGQPCHGEQDYFIKCNNAKNAVWKSAGNMNSQYYWCCDSSVPASAIPNIATYEKYQPKTEPLNCNHKASNCESEQGGCRATRKMFTPTCKNSKQPVRLYPDENIDFNDENFVCCDDAVPTNTNYKYDVTYDWLPKPTAALFGSPQFTSYYCKHDSANCNPTTCLAKKGEVKPLCLNAKFPLRQYTDAGVAEDKFSCCDNMPSNTDDEGTAAEIELAKSKKKSDSLKKAAEDFKKIWEDSMTKYNLNPTAENKQAMTDASTDYINAESKAKEDENSGVTTIELDDAANALLIWLVCVIGGTILLICCCVYFCCMRKQQSTIIVTGTQPGMMQQQPGMMYQQQQPQMMMTKM